MTGTHLQPTLALRLTEARARTDALFSIVRPDALYERPVPERHRLVFYIGHLEAFDWNLIGRGPLGLTGFHPSFDRLFAFGIDPPPGKLPQDQPADWPELDEVQAYNARVRDTLDRALAHVPEQFLHVAIEHRLMHAETFAYLLHNLPFSQKLGPAAQPVAPGRPPACEMVPVAGGRVVLGRNATDGFGWDNEFEALEVPVGDFAMSKYKVTNQDYLRFVEDGAPPPHFWRRRGARWYYRGMFEEIPLPADWPVYVTQKEAASYAMWAGKRLPSEPEFHRAAYGAVDAPHPAPAAPRDNFDFCHWDPVPVTSSDENPLGLAQMVGNGWEWTSTVFGPLPGFRPFPFYPGYSANFFDGEHYVIKGASPRTAACFTRPSFRNWFRPEYPYVYAGFRVAES